MRFAYRYALDVININLALKRTLQSMEPSTMLPNQDACHHRLVRELNQHNIGVLAHKLRTISSVGQRLLPKIADSAKKMV